MLIEKKAKLTATDKMGKYTIFVSWKKMSLIIRNFFSDLLNMSNEMLSQNDIFIILFVNSNTSIGIALVFKHSIFNIYFYF